MRHTPALRIGALLAVIIFCLEGHASQSGDTQTEARGLPPRVAPADYQSHAQAGAAVLAAEFKGHSIPTAEATFTTTEFVVVEAALFGPAGTRAQLSAADFSLRINGRKTPLPAQPYGLVVASAKDPEWEPPAPPASKSKTSMGGGARGDRGADGPPAPVPVPIGVQRAMAQRIQKAALPEGDRALPQAGLIFFPYRGKAQGIESIELIYTGSAGKAILRLQP